MIAIVITKMAGTLVGLLQTVVTVTYDEFARDLLLEILNGEIAMIERWPRGYVIVVEPTGLALGLAFGAGNIEQQIEALS